MLENIKKIIHNPYFFSVTSKVFGVIVGFIFTIFQARYLGAEIKGQVATVNSTVGVVSIISGLGIYLSYPFFKRNSDKDVMPVFLHISLLLLGVYSVISAIVILFYHSSPKLTAVLVLNPLLVYDGIVSYITLIEIPNKRNATDMAVMFLELLILLALWFTAPPSFALGILVITIKDIVKALLFTIWWRKKISIHTDSLPQWIPKVVKYGFFPMLALLMNTLNYRIDVLMLNGRVSDASIGVYSVGVLLAERVWLATDAMKGVMVSNITKGKDANETAYVIRICNTLCLFFLLGIVLVGKPFISFIFGSEYNGAYQVTLIILAGVFPMNYYKMIDAYNIAIGKQIISFFLMIIGVICNVIANWLLIPIKGIYGAGIASVISYTLCSAAFIVYFCHSTKLSFLKMLIMNKKDFRMIKNVFSKGKQKES